MSLSHVDLAWNWTRTSLENFSEKRTISEFLGKPLDEPIDFSLMTPRREVELEEMNPEHRMVLTGSHQLGSWNAVLRPATSAPGRPAASRTTAAATSTPSTGRYPSTPKSAMPSASATG